MVNDMDYKSTVRKHGIIIAICVICSLLVVAGTSYALFFQTHVNSENQVLKTGTLAVTYSNDSSKITLERLLPVSDETGLTDDSYKSSVKIENTGSLWASYVLKIGKDTEALQTAGASAEDLVGLQYVKIMAYAGETPLMNEPVTLNSMTPDDDGLYEIHTGSLQAGANEVITVRLWLDSATPADQSGKLVCFKLDVKSIVDEENTPEGQAANS